MRLRLLFCLFVVLGGVMPGWAQQDGLLQLNDPLHHFLLRQQVLGRLPDAFLSHQPLSAYEAQRYLDTLDSLATQTIALSPVDWQLYARFQGRTPGPGVSTFRKVMPFSFRNGRDFVSIAHKDYALQVNPLFYLTYGRARQTAREDGDTSTPVWQNTRGVRASGHIGKHIFFETRLQENQRRDVWPAFKAFEETAPRLGTTKFNEGNQSYDYWFVTGLVGFKSKYFEVRLGRDHNRWGFGKGSLMLSNYATTYDQLQIRTTFWRVQYTNLFTSLASPSAGQNDFVPRRYGAFHRIAITLPAGFQAELFETVMFASSDSLGLRDAGFDVAYLNPIIFYRAVEVERAGRLDNTLLGGGLAWVALPGLRLHTQLLLDEFRLGQIGKKWWANKWGWLAGVDLVDWPLSNLMVRMEYARLRPYLYSHRSPTAAYLHFDDLLGHPAGANAQDIALFLDYQPATRLRAALTLAYTQRGRNTDTENFGSDPSISSNIRVSDTDVGLLQGVRQNQWLVEAYAGYELLPDVYLELAVRAESIDDAETGLDRYVAPFLMLRWGLPFQSTRY